MIVDAINVVENESSYYGTNQTGEPQLGRRGLYSEVGGNKNSVAANMAMLWTLNFSDGAHTLLDIAERANLPFSTIHEAARRLAAHGLLIEDRPGA
jgi:aminopeptidase-like protein